MFRRCVERIRDRLDEFQVWTNARVDEYEDDADERRDNKVFHDRILAAKNHKIKQPQKAIFRALGGCVYVLFVA